MSFFIKLKIKKISLFLDYHKITLNLDKHHSWRWNYKIIGILSLELILQMDYMFVLEMKIKMLNFMLDLVIILHLLKVLSGEDIGGQLLIKYNKLILYGLNLKCQNIINIKRKMHLNLLFFKKIRIIIKEVKLIKDKKVI